MYIFPLCYLKFVYDCFGAGFHWWSMSEDRIGRPLMKSTGARSSGYWLSLDYGIGRRNAAGRVTWPICIQIAREGKKMFSVIKNWNFRQIRVICFSCVTICVWMCTYVWKGKHFTHFCTILLSLWMQTALQIWAHKLDKPSTPNPTPTPYPHPPLIQHLHVYLGSCNIWVV